VDIKKIPITLHAIVLFLSIYSLAGIASAKPDLSFSSYYRSEPVGGAFEIEAGYAQRFWGFSANKQSSALFGYLRPFAGYTQINDYNASYGGLDIFPVGLFGARVMTTAIQNEGGYDAYDCTTYLCDGEFREDRIQYFLLAPIGRFYFAGTWTKDKLISRDVNREGALASFTEYIHPSSGLAVQNTFNDSVVRMVGTVGFRLNDQWSLLAQQIQWQVDSNEMESRMITSGFSYTARYVDIKLMGGEFRSDLPEKAKPNQDRKETTFLFNLTIPLFEKDGYF
jgi:hypothetical protein